MTKKSTSKVVAKAKPAQAPAAPMTPPALLAIAVEQGADIDKLEKLMSLQERWEANEAKKAFTVSMAAFKANPPEILKDRTVKYKNKGGGFTEFDHASLSNVAAMLGEALSEHGLSFGWVTNQEAQLITVTCTVTHIMGHSEPTSLSASPDASGGKNSIQAVGSTVSYLQRYTLLAITGTATQDMDDDGAASSPRQPDYDCINDDQISQLNELVIAAHVNPQKILGGFEITDIIQLPADRFQECVERLNAAKAAYDKKQEGEDGDTPAAIYKCTECGEALVHVEGTACDECLSHID